MKERYDVVIIGGGIAGVSAALSCRNRGKTAAVIANGAETSSLYKAEKITNYPGVPSVSGKELSELLLRQLSDSGAELIRGRALSVIPLGDSFGVAVGSEFTSCLAVIIAAGITREKLYPGEGEFLGRGVSYCATCDGMLYRGKTVAVIGSGEEASRDADFLESIGCTVLRMTKPLRYEIRGGLKADTQSRRRVRHQGHRFGHKACPGSGVCRRRDRDGQADAHQYPRRIRGGGLYGQALSACQGRGRGERRGALRLRVYRQ